MNIVKKGEEKASIKGGICWSNNGGKKLSLMNEDIINRSGVNKGKKRVKGLMGRYPRVGKWEAFSNKKIGLREEDIIDWKGVNKEKKRENGLMGRYSRVEKWEAFSNKKLGLREEDII